MNPTDKLKSTIQGLFAAAILLVGGNAANQVRAQEDCCRPGAACCYPGSSCCAGHAHTPAQRAR